MTVVQQRRTFYPRLEGMSREEVRALQLKKLQMQIERIYHTNPFYQERFRQAGVSPDQIRSLQDIKRLPFVAKEDLIQEQNRHPPYGRHLGVPENKIWEITLSSGTSGKGQEIHGFTMRDAHMRGALAAIVWYWAGVDRPDAVIFNIGATNSASRECLFRGIRAAGRMPYLVGHLGFEERLELMLKLGFEAMHAMPSALNGLSVLCERKGIDPKKAWPNLKCIMMAGEAWPVEFVQRMEEFWGTRLFEEYGSTQTLSTFGLSNCERGAVIDGQRGFMHLFEWSFLYEVVDPETGEDVKPGEPGELIITHLDKEASPLVRYRTRDRVTYYPYGACPCGRALDLVQSGTVGRLDDMLKVKGQNIWPQEVDAIVFSHPNVEEYQARVYIGEKGRDEVEMRLSFKPGLNMSPSERAAFIQRLVRELKEATEVTFNVREVSSEELPKFTTPDRKPRRWTDDRQADLARGVSGQVNSPPKGQSGHLNSALPRIW